MPSRKPTESQIIRDPEQVRALLSPMRNSIHHLVLNQGPISVREIAEQLGRQPAALYRHVEFLVQAGLISEVGSRSTTRRDAKLYSAELAYLAYDADDEDMVEALCDFTLSMTRKAGNEMAHSMRSGKARTRKGVDERDTHISKIFGWLHPDDLKEVNEHIDAIVEIFSMKRREPGTELISMALVLAPMPVSEHNPNE